MEKKFVSSMNRDQEEYLKQRLYERYKDVFESHGIESMQNTQICNMAEFLITEHPEKYARTAGDENNYRSNEHLKKIYAVVSNELQTAVLINTDKEGKVPEGEFGTYDLNNNKFNMSEKVREEIVNYLGIGGLEKERQDKIINTIFPGRLADMDKLATMDLERVIDSKISDEAKKDLISKQIDEQNEENGISKEERNKYENKKDEKSQDKNEMSEEEKDKLPEDVKKGMQRAGSSQIVRYFYVNANELGNKIDGAKVDKNGGKVLMMEVADSSRATGPNRYYAFQDNKTVLRGNEDDKVRDIVGEKPTVGQVLEPLRKNEPEFIEYRDSNGLYIKEQIDDKFDLSAEEIQKYQYDMEKELEIYSKRINIVLDSDMSPEEKIESLHEIDRESDYNTTKYAEQYGISDRNDDDIDNKTTEKVNELAEDIEKEAGDDEPEAFEVPGKRTR